MSGMILDLVIVAVLLLAVVRGYQKGLVLTICGFLAVFVAFFGAVFVSNALAEPVSHAIRPVVEQSISAAVEKGLEEQGWTLPQESQSASLSGEGTEDVLGQFSLEEVLELIQGSEWMGRLGEAFQTAVGEGLLEITTNAAQALSGYIAREVTRMVLFGISFALILVAWTLVSRGLDLAFHLPVLYTANRWLGGGVGLLKGGVLVFIVCWLLREMVSPETIGGSVLLKWFCTTNPFEMLANLFG